MNLTEAEDIKKRWQEYTEELCDIVQEVEIKTIPKKKKCKKAKWLPQEALQIAELQRIARRDKKAFLSDQCKEIEENNGMRQTRDLFKKIRDTKGTFHAKMGSIKHRNGMDLTDAEDIKKKWQEYTELYKKKILMTQISERNINNLSYADDTILMAESEE